MMGRAVGSDKACTVKDKHDVQILQSDVMDDLIVSALEER